MSNGTFAGIGAIQGALNPGGDTAGYLSRLQQATFDPAREQRAQETHDLDMELGAADLIQQYQKISTTDFQLQRTAATQKTFENQAKVAEAASETAIESIPMLNATQKSKTRAALSLANTAEGQAQLANQHQALSQITDEVSYERMITSMKASGLDPAQQGFPMEYNAGAIAGRKKAIEGVLTSSTLYSQAGILNQQKADINAEQAAQSNKFATGLEQFRQDNRIALEEQRFQNARELAIIKANAKGGVGEKVDPSFTKGIPDPANQIKVAMPILIKEFGIDLEDDGTFDDAQTEVAVKTAIQDIYTSAKAGFDKELRDYEVSERNVKLYPITSIESRFRSLVKDALPQAVQRSWIDSYSKTSNFRDNPKIKNATDAQRAEILSRLWALSPASHKLRQTSATSALQEQTPYGEYID